MGKRNKRFGTDKAAIPDEIFSNGPLHVARFGNQVVLASNRTEKQHDELLTKLAARYTTVVQEIDDLVCRIISAVSVLPPDQLLVRAWHENFMSSQHIKVEVDITEDDAIALRMIDYVQSVIAAAPRGDAQKTELTDDDWSDLRLNVAALFRKLNFEYPSCSTAHRKAEGTVYDDAMELFFVRAQMHWCNVRGDNYQVHQADLIADLLRNQSKLIEAAYGITSDVLTAEIRKIWRSLTFGFHEAMTSVRQIHAEVMAEVDRMENQKDMVYEFESPSDLIHEVTSRLGHQDTLHQSMDALFGNTGLFDLCKITNLPTAFLEDFSWAPGQETNFLADGEFKGWPFRIQPIFRRPFLKFNDTYYCFELHSLFDNFYRQLEKQIFQRSGSEKQEWIRKRKEMSEELPVDYFTRLLPGATVLREVYYPVVSESGSKKNFAETDCIIAYDDHLFIIEVKAGAFTYTSPASDLPAYVKSLQALVGAPSKQGQRFLNYLEGSEEVEIFDEQRQRVGTLRRGDYRSKTICTVTLDSFTELAAQVQHLHKIGIDVADEPIWSLSLSDLQVYSDIFAGPLDFLHYVEQRMRAAQSEKLQLDDELDHLGLYLEHNNYAMHADELSNNAGRLQFNGYRSAIDAYFSEKLIGSENPSLPTQEVPPRLREIINLLTHQNLPHRSRIASFLLDFDGDWRFNLSKWIDEELAVIPERGRCLPLSTVGNIRLTIFVNIEGIVELSHERATEHTQVAMIVTGESDRTLLELTYGPTGPTRVTMSTVSLLGLSHEQHERLRANAANLKEKRLTRFVANFGKIGRNDHCPCGSGKKFKQCCMP
ncbi:SEC-C metal-binding domain-containing protein [Halothiobacillus sp.]|uniref:YecA family protein n=1 Tax=Halothiobacillus sp. TaxID=1891311 RepID=UPI00261C7C4C|nr:SEC-C metal-binding domain-containing protein [Halothiobacillus sp.]MDD4965386.1 SEC-C metal-binding domain-containing protein [Halothiobacillus sp.]